MGTATANVYGFGVHLKSKDQPGYLGDSVAVVATTADQARADLTTVYGDDLGNVSGPNVMAENVVVLRLPRAADKAAEHKAAPAEHAKQKDGGEEEQHSHTEHPAAKKSSR